MHSRSPSLLALHKYSAGLTCAFSRQAFGRFAASGLRLMRNVGRAAGTKGHTMNPVIEELIKIARTETHGPARADMVKEIAKIYAVQAILESRMCFGGRDKTYAAIIGVFSTMMDDLERVLARVLPFGEASIFDRLNARWQGSPYTVWPVAQPLRVPSENDESIILKTLDYISRGVSILSGIAIIVLVALLWSGQTTIGTVQIGTLLTMLSFTLVGSLISIGGVKMFTINASLRKAKERIERVITTTGACPFSVIFAGQPIELRRPGNPYFCAKCPLGIDIDSTEEGGLIHTCSVYMTLHRQWKELPGAEGILHK